ncbi:MAG: PDDEXK nuclease domain-containing protein [Bacteroidia bacterium]
MNFKLLVNGIQQTHDALQSSAVKAVNRHITIRNWLIGFYIVEFEQNGDDRAKYGEKLIEKLALKLSNKSLSSGNLKVCRQFYIQYSEIRQTLSGELKNHIRQTLSGELILPKLSNQFKSSDKTSPIKKKIRGTVSPELVQGYFSNELIVSKNDKPIKHLVTLFNQTSFSHLAELMKIGDPIKRSYYELMILKTGLTVRSLRRQIATLAFERTGLSKNKKLSLDKIEKKITPAIAADAVKDYYFFEFLDLPNIEFVEESQLETALLNHLEKFILELGNGFCFEARQKKILIGDEYFSIDMVFYHRILHCHVLIDLKVDKFSHSHVSQLNAYLNYYAKEVKQKTDNPPIGILLVTDKNKALVEYTTTGLNQKLFVSKYLMKLPTKKQLEDFIKRELKKFDS